MKKLMLALSILITLQISQIQANIVTSYMFPSVTMWAGFSTTTDSAIALLMLMSVVKERKPDSFVMPNGMVITLHPEKTTGQKLFEARIPKTKINILSLAVGVCLLCCGYQQFAK